MGLFLDSFDNDAQKNNPFVALMINDGTRQYDHQTDGSQQMLSGYFSNSRLVFENKLVTMVPYLMTILENELRKVF